MGHPGGVGLRVGIGTEPAAGIQEPVAILIDHGNPVAHATAAAGEGRALIETQIEKFPAMYHMFSLLFLQLFSHA